MAHKGLCLTLIRSSLTINSPCTVLHAPVRPTLFHILGCVLLSGPEVEVTQFVVCCYSIPRKQIQPPTYHALFRCCEYIIWQNECPTLKNSRSSAEGWTMRHGHA